MTKFNEERHGDDNLKKSQMSINLENAKAHLIQTLDHVKDLRFELTRIEDAIYKAIQDLNEEMEKK